MGVNGTRGHGAGNSPLAPPVAGCIGLMTPRQKIVTGTVELLTGAVLQYFRALGNDLIANC